MDKRAEARKRYIESDISQRELAAEFGVHFTTVARWSREENWPELRKQHASKMQAAASKALDKAIESSGVQKAAKSLAEYLEQVRKALDFGLSLTIKGLREPGLSFNDLGQGINALTKIAQTQVNIAEFASKTQGDDESDPLERLAKAIEES